MSRSKGQKKQESEENDFNKVVLIHSEKGNIKRVVELSGSLYDAVKKAAFEALQLWNPETSDFVIMRDNYTKTLKLPLTKEQYEVYSKFEMRRGSKEAEVVVPIYIASFNNEWRETDYYDNEIFIVAPKLPEEDLEELKRRAMIATSEEQLEVGDLGGLEEDLEELEEEEEEE